MRTKRNKAKKKLISTAALMFAILIAVGITFYVKQLNKLSETTEETITVKSVKPISDSFIELKTNKGKSYYTHEVNREYIERELDKGYDIFDITERTNVFNPFRPKKEIINVKLNIE